MSTLLSRSQILAALGVTLAIALAVTITVPPITHGAAGKITIASAGGAYDECQRKTFAADWERETKIKAVYGSAGYDTGVWKAQQKAGKVEWDVAPVDANQFHQLLENGWIVPLDGSIVERNGGLIDFPDLAPRRGNQVYGIPSEIFAMVITYNTDKFGKNPPKTWADVFDTAKYPGKRLFSKFVADFGVLEMALLADGVPKNKLYPLDVERGLRKLDTIKKDILWYDFGTQQITLLQQGEAVIGAGWDGRVKVLQREGGRVDFTANDSIVRPDYWVIPKGGDVEVANRFLDFVTRPAEQAKFAACIGYAPGFKNAYALLPTDQKFSINIKDLSNVVIWGTAYWKENARKVTTRFNEWLTK